MMSELPRLNSIIAALEAGTTAFATFAQAERETAIAMSTSAYDGVIFEMEHNPWDIAALRDGLQYLLNRGQIARSGSVAAPVTPLVRIPPNGAEKAQFHAKQALTASSGRISRRSRKLTMRSPLAAIRVCQANRATNRPAFAATGRRRRFAIGA
jgi:4-hydroxy-2-oxoheptanedioate aldolase